MSDISKKRIITYGTFDMFHIGYLKLLQRLSELGTKKDISTTLPKKGFE